MSRTFLIDTDTASDDAVALIMALRAPDVQVAGITVVWGNVPVEQGVRNALYVTELCGADVPVHQGAARPLRRQPSNATWFHGHDGLGDHGFAPSRRQKTSDDAVDALIELVRAAPGCVLVTLGPLTNVALALARDRRFATGISRAIVMGGAACTVGNVTPAAEYNVWADPEAAQEVFRSALPIEMVGWELCRGPANLTADDMRRVRALDTPLAHFALDCNSTAIEANRRQSGDVGLALPDPVAMGIALDPDLCTRRSAHYVDVDIASELTRGMTVVDALNVAEDERNRAAWAPLLERGRRTEVCWALDIARWKELVIGSLGHVGAQNGSPARTS
jgi:purine nucleosidase